MIKQKRLLSILIGGLLACSLNLRAETLDLATTNDVVSRLEKLLTQIDTQSDSYLPMQLRLADLYADRARLFEIKDGNAETDTLKKAKEDRKQAIAIYEKALPNLKGEDQSRVLGQTAHLYQLVDQKQKSRELYSLILKHPKKYSKDLLVQSYLGLGEMALSQAKYSEAEKNFKAAIALRPKNSYVIGSRLAWTNYHNNNPELAVTTLTNVLSQIPASESTFREEVSKDFASFLAHTPVRTAQIEFLAKNSPENVRHENLVFLAGELDRLGKKTEALYVWKFLGEQVQASSDYEEHLRLAQIQYDLGHKADAAKEVELFVKTLKTKTCDPKKDNCDLMRLKLRKLLTDWAKSEEREPSRGLIQSYGSYLSVYGDLDISYWAAQSSDNIKAYDLAIKFYRMSANLAQAEISREASHHNSKVENIFEGACLGEIAVSEKLNNPLIKNAAYEHYLKADPHGSSILSVRYQRAYLDYDQKNFEEAAQKMHSIALSDSSFHAPKDRLYKDKAADTSIEALIALHDQSRLATWADEYAKNFSNRKSEFQTISRNAILTQESQKINEAKSQDDVKSGLAHLEQIDLKNLGKDDKLKVLMSKLAAAEKIKDLDSVRRIAGQILDIKSINANQKDLALSRLEWVAEMRFEFATAFSIAHKLNMANLSSAERSMKLAVLCELAGHNPSPYYETYLQKSHDQASNDQVMAKLIRSAKNPKAEFSKFEAKLKHNTSLIAELGLEIFAKNQEAQFAQHMLRIKGVAQTPAGATFSRFLFIQDFHSHKSLIARTRLDTSTPLKLKSSLKLRMALIKQAQKLFDKTAKMSDWSLELMALNIILLQEKNLSQDIKNLPVPRNLKANDRLQYKKLLADQSAPYEQKVNELESEIAKLWSQGQLDHLYQEVRQTEMPVRSLLMKEIKFAVQYAPSAQKSISDREIAKLNHEISKRPSQMVIRATQAEAQARPFDINKLLQLKEIEKKANNQTFVAYLDHRLSEAGSVR
jgi:hypothetical protein